MTVGRTTSVTAVLAEVMWRSKSSGYRVVPGLI